MIELEPSVEKRIVFSLPEIDQKHPNGIREYLSEFAEINVIHTHPLPEQDAIAMGEHLADYYIQYADALITNHTGEHDYRLEDPSLENLYCKAENITHITQEATKRCVSDLDIPDVAKRYLGGIIENVSIVTNRAHFGHSFAVCEDEKNIVSLDILSIMSECEHIMTCFHEEDVSFMDIFRGVLSFTVSHEIGHIIDQNIASPTLLLSTKYMSDYPLYSSNEKDQVNFINVQEWISGERFADFFGEDIVKGLGYRSTILVDYIRSGALHIFGDNFTFVDQQKILNIAGWRLLDEDNGYDKEKNEMALYILKQSLFNILTSGVVHMQYPYSKEIVTEMITTGWEQKMNMAIGVDNKTHI